MHKFRVIELHVTLTPRDFKAFQVFLLRAPHLSKNRIPSSWPLLLIGLLVGGGLATADRTGILPIHWPSAIVALLFGFLISFISFFQVVRRSQEQRLPSPGGVLLDRRHYTFDENGVHFSAHRQDGFYRWTAFTSLQENARYFFLMLDDHQALILPKAAFPEDLAERFGIIAKARIMIADSDGDLQPGTTPIKSTQ
jgi:hypothetical protein